ncbi:hypothetical protein ACFYO0_23905 [Streptomyces sp. NPDC006365]|uniref:hypothetical protein n=1 Tax=Streptomyces sp. NPDC006365 TaxID=3364744 RepID=UPI0036A797FA
MAGGRCALIAAEVSLAIVSSLAERAAVRTVVPGEQLPAALSQNEARGRIAGAPLQQLDWVIRTPPTSQRRRHS